MGTLKEVKERLEEIAKYGAINGVSFCIYTKNNNNIIKDYL